MSIVKIIKCNLCGEFAEIDATEFYPPDWRIFNIYKTGTRVFNADPEKNVDSEDYNFTVCPKHTGCEFRFGNGCMGISKLEDPTES